VATAIATVAPAVVVSDFGSFLNMVVVAMVVVLLPAVPARLWGALVLCDRSR
jgi:hypothetical protein